MRINELLNEQNIHIKGLDISKDDPRYELYAKSLENYTKYSRHIANLLHTMYRGRKFKPTYWTQHDIQMLDDIMYNHPIKIPITVFHGCHESPLKLWKKHNVPLDKSIFILLPAFTSTSTDLKIATHFTSETTFIGPNNKKIQQMPILAIEVPAGTPALSVKNFSSFPQEKEVLLGRGCVLKVKANVRDITAYHGPNPYCIFMSKIVDVRPQELGFTESETIAEDDSEFKFLGVA